MHMPAVAALSCSIASIKALTLEHHSPVLKMAAYHVTNRTFGLSYPAFHRSNGDNAMHKVSIMNDSPPADRKQHLRIEGSRSGRTVLDLTQPPSQRNPVQAVCNQQTQRPTTSASAVSQQLCRESGNDW